MKIIDIYIIKKYLSTFFFMIGMIIVIIIIFDISEKIDDFIEHNAPFKGVVFEYYFNFIPFLINMFSGLIAFISVIYFTSKMASKSEIVAILGSGISFNRLLFPYLLTSLFLALFSFYLANFVIPHANEVRNEFELNFMKHKTYKAEKFIHFQMKPGFYISLYDFNPMTKTGSKVKLQQLEDGVLKTNVTGDYLRWDSINAQWTIDKYSIRAIDGMKETLKTGERLDTVLPIEPLDLTNDIINVQVLSFRELREFIRISKFRGSENIAFYEIEKHRRLAYPFSVIILSFIGVAFSSRKLRGGIGLHLAFGLL
ncbi:MAG: LptF/LptG family permease, partial [Bacteroidales bacterium]|nr:LptF/LptG family permease [Bacteroidales bacterium]